MKALIITQCGNTSLWYNHMVGSVVILAKPADIETDIYWTTEPDGYLNIIYKQDAELTEVGDGPYWTK